MKNISYIENVESWVSRFSYSYPIKVRFSETDAFGHLNNTKVFVYFEEGRIEFFKEIGLMQEWLSSGGEGIPVTSDLQCDYLRQLYFDDRLNIFVKVHSIGRTSVDLHYMIKNEKDEVCITGRGRMVQVHKKTGKPMEWDENMKKKLETSITTMNI
ncbi:acyl-CoA thioesterase [Anaerobacillus alkaliphilus]|uniref:Acyl-CoA thioesterase n=1 Tax=Anaerobacillus alkaliphilus TaxID=1548597 RepID=A0A4Q0VQK1_9BACI|nr:thioesterase family protein [Anaerobacillus alkaliphilus]RXI98469.1 acyl-CoA thioesterase [Anaerobacillus alkaliphilus]